MTIPIYVTTSDRYLPALLPFAHQLNKYWTPNPPVFVGGFTPPDFALPDNFKFITIGPPEKYPFEKWTNALRKMLNSLSDDLFILMLEDYWVTGPCDVDAIQAVGELCNVDKQIIRMDLTLDRARSGKEYQRHYGNLGPLELVQSRPDSPYHMSLMTAIWRKQHLLRVLRNDWSPWEVELSGTPELSKHPELKVIGTTSRLVPHTLAFRSGESSNLIVDDLSRGDVEELRELGLLAHWEEAVA